MWMLMSGHFLDLLKISIRSQFNHYAVKELCEAVSNPTNPPRSKIIMVNSRDARVAEQISFA